MKIYPILLSFYCIVIMTSCFKQKNETPETNSNYDPALFVNFTLKELNDLAPAEGTPLLLDSDWRISCIVRADDESGNIYNQLIIEDQSAGIAISLNENTLYSRFPIGKKLYINLKGLYLGNYHGTMQLGAAPAPDNAGLLQVSDIAAKHFSEHIVVANLPAAMPPQEVNMDDLIRARPDLSNRLIRITDAEFTNPNYDNIYADPSAATSIKLRNCGKGAIVLRTSNYARFQSVSTPYGNGTITGIYSIYNGAGQLTIRDTGDVQMNRQRCDGSTSSVATLMTLEAVRNIYKGKDTLLGNFKIRAIVTSDNINKNFGTGNIIVQQNNKAIMVYFGSSAVDMPDLGDSVELNIAGATLTKYNGALEIKNIKTSKAIILAKNKSVQPVTLTIAALNAGFANYESVLVKIINAKITTTGNFSGNNTLSDASGTIVLYTSSVATFAILLCPLLQKHFKALPRLTVLQMK